MASSAGLSLIGCIAAPSQSQINLVAVHILSTDAWKAAASILSINLQIFHADRLFSMPKLLSFMPAGRKGVTFEI
jgi:hypothetical protein